jgi:hypothetical protein
MNTNRPETIYRDGPYSIERTSIDGRYRVRGMGRTLYEEETLREAGQRLLQWYCHYLPSRVERVGGELALLELER